MMIRSNLFRAFFSVALAASARSEQPSVPLQQVNYTDINDPGFAMMGYMSMPADSDGGPLPAVVILPDWTNVDSYEMSRAEMIADLGYIGFTADIFGADMHDVQDRGVSIQQAVMYRSNMTLYMSRIQSAINVVAADPGVDADRIALIGYCFGGTGAIAYSFANINATESSIVGAVSFHGGLMDFPVGGEMASPLLVLSGGNDDAGTAVEDLESTLEEANATWQITRYSGVYHGFTVFGSPAYNQWVDERSWMEMSSFLSERFGEVTYGTIQPQPDVEYTVAEAPEEVGGTIAMARQADNAMVTVQTVPYDNDGFELQGYLAVPADLTEGETRPAIVILPDWDGVNGPTGYEASRAVMAAQEGGYIAMVADIYGTNYTDVEDFQTRGQLAGFYRSDPELFVSRIQAGIDQVLNHPAVDTSNIFVAGYCFGGTGSVDYGFSADALQNVRAVVPIHGGLTPLRAIQTDVIQPYVLVLSGGIDDAHGNTTELEMHLDSANATWEVSRYSNAQHGFSHWGPRYDAMADSRSWWAMMSLFDTLSMEASMEMEEHHDGDDHDDHDHDHDHDHEEEMAEAMTDEHDDHDGHDDHDHDHDDHEDHDSHDDHEDHESHDDHDHDHDHEDEEEVAAAIDDSSASGRFVYGGIAASAALFAALAV